MSDEEDNELRDLVAHTLESNGVLNKIRAQLRASVFLALEEQTSKENKPPLVNNELKDFINTDDGETIVCLIREFLQYFNLEFTQSVYSPETGEDIQYTYIGRDELCEKLNLNLAKNHDGPLIVQLLRRSRNGAASTSNQQLTNERILAAKENFQNRDKDKNDKIDKESICDLFMEIFPNFRRSLIERFVNEEYQTMGKNFNEEIEFEEFRSMYQKLFNVCQSVVNHDTSLFIPSSNRLKSRFTQSSDNNTTFTINSKPKNDKTSDHFPLEKSVASLPPEETNNETKDDEDEDSFFDDKPLIPTASTTAVKVTTKPKNESSRISGGAENETRTNSIFNDPLPPLVSARGATNHEIDQEFESRLADLGLGTSHDDDYYEDFQSSEHKTESEEPSIGEEIEDDDTSAFNELLASTASGASLPGIENITTDKTVSDVSQSGVDYLESFHQESKTKNKKNA